MPVSGMNKDDHSIKTKELGNKDIVTHQNDTTSPINWHIFLDQELTGHYSCDDHCCCEHWMGILSDYKQPF